MLDVNERGDIMIDDWWVVRITIETIELAGLAFHALSSTVRL